MIAMPRRRRSARRASVAAIVTLLALLSIALLGSADGSLAPDWRADANTICQVFFASTENLRARATRQSDGFTSPSAQRRRALAATLARVARASLRADSRLARIRVPAAHAPRYKRLIALDRTGGRTLLAVAAALREPKNREHDRRVEILMTRSGVLGTRYERHAKSLKLERCIAPAS